MHSSISCYALEAGYTRLARKMETYITSNMVELPQMLERRDTHVPANPCMYTYIVHVHTHCISVYQSANSISSRSDYSRAASISFRACSGAAAIRKRRLFESGVYSVIYGTCTCNVVVILAELIASGTCSWTISGIQCTTCTQMYMYM